MVATVPAAGAHYPRSMGEVRAWFSTDDDCRDYLEWLRWPSGFVCPECSTAGGWRLTDGRLMCAACGNRTSVTAGTIFDRTRTPLTVWFMACWLFASQKDGVSALSLQRALEIGSYQTAWAMLQRLRSVLVRPGRERLSGMVEVDETLIGGTAEGDQGGRTSGEKALVGIAVERLEPKGFGRCRMAILADASTDSLRAFLVDHVEEGSTVITDGWQPYRQAAIGRTPIAGTLPLGHKRQSCFRGYTGSPPSPSGGCSGRTRGGCWRLTWLAIWTSSCSVSIAAAPAAGALSSTGCSSSP